jgi:hypothetical protein
MSSERRHDGPSATVELVQDNVEVTMVSDKGNGAPKVDEIESEATMITPDNVEQLLVEETLDDEEIILEPPEGFEEIAEPILIEAIEIDDFESEEADSAAEESPWIELETIDLPERGASIEPPELIEAGSEAYATKDGQPEPVAVPVEIPSGSAAPARRPMSISWWMLGAVVLSAALGALAALVILGRINGGLAYTAMTRGVDLSEAQNRLSTEIATLGRDIRDVQAELVRLDDLASELDTVSRSLDAVEGDLGVVSDEIVSLTGGLDELSVGLGDLGSSLGSLDGEVTVLETDLTSLADDTAALQETSLALETSVGALDTGLSELGGQVDLVAEEVATFRESKEKFDSFLDGLRQLLSDAAPTE